MGREHCTIHDQPQPCLRCQAERDQARQAETARVLRAYDANLIKDLRAEIAKGGSHECDKWRDADGVCKLCDQKEASQ